MGLNKRNKVTKSVSISRVILFCDIKCKSVLQKENKRNPSHGRFEILGNQAQFTKCTQLQFQYTTTAPISESSVRVCERAPV